MASPLPLPWLRRAEATRHAQAKAWRLDVADVAAAGALWLAACLVYFRYRLMFQTGDSLSYLGSAQSGLDLFHPQHLLFNGTIRAVYLGLSTVCASCKALEAAVLVGIASAGLVLVCAYLIVRRLTGSRALALGTGATLLACYGIWRYATQAEVYHPSLVFLALIATVLVFKGPAWERRHVLGLGVLLFLSIMYHQSNVLMAAPLALYLALEPSTAMGGAGRWRGMTVAAAVLAVAGGFTLAAYGAAFAAGDQAWTKRDLHEFLFRMATFPYDDWGSWSNYSKAGLRAFAEAHLWMFSPKFAFIHHRVTQLFLAGLGTLAAINVAQALRGATGWRLRVFLLAWLAVWYGFNLWWLPGEGEFYIIALFPLLLLCAITLRDILGPVDRLWHGWLPAAGLCGLAAWLAAINHGAILPEHESAGQAYWEAEQVNAVAPPGCAVAHDWYVNGNLGYHFQRQTYEIALSRMYFLLDAPFPTWLKTTEKVCTVTFLESIDPGFHYVATAPQMNPVGYRAWLMWLFDYQPGEGEAPGTMRRFEIATGAEGAAYLVLHTERRYVQDFRGMLGVLDGAMNAHLGEERNMFRQWFEERYWEMLLRL